MRAKVACVLLLVFGSGFALATADEVLISYATQVEPLFLAECGDCHAGKKAKKGLDLSAGVGYDHLVGVAANEVPGLKLVEPGDPDASYLWQKLTHAAAEGKGMPRTLFGAKKLSDDNLELVKRWIEGGANP